MTPTAPPVIAALDLQESEASKFCIGLISVIGPRVGLPESLSDSIARVFIAIESKTSNNGYH